MRQFNSSDIPDVLEIVAKHYMTKERLTPTETDKINTFFMNYMDKAFTNCEKLSKAHWSFPRKNDDVGFHHQAVEISAGTKENKVRFIVATGFTPLNKVSTKPNEKQIEIFKQLFIDDVLNNLSDVEGDDWTTVFNKLSVTANAQDKAYKGMFICIKFNEAFFSKEEKAA